MDKLVVLAELFGVSTDYLLKEDGEAPPPAKDRRLPVVLAAALAIALGAAVWLGVSAGRAGAERDTLAAEKTALETAEDQLQTELQASQEALEAAQSQPPQDLGDWNNYFYQFGQTYRVDYMPTFTAGDAPKESTAYLYWAFAINLDNWGEEKGTMSRTYVEQAVANHFGVTGLVHLPMVKGWDYDGEVYTAYPESLKELPIYTVSSCRIYREEDGWLYYEVILDAYRHKEGVLIDPSGMATLEEVWAQYGRQNLEVAGREKLVYYYRNHQQIPVFVHGDFVDCLPDDPARYAYRRTFGAEKLFVLLNFSGDQAAFWQPADMDPERWELLVCNYPVPEESCGLLRPYEARVYYQKEDESL